MNKGKICRVSLKQMREYICRYAPRGRFLAKKGNTWIALDNSTCDAWVEVFSRKRQAVRWLLGKFEVGGLAEQWDRITDADGLIRAAMRQGVTLDVADADMILGYFEGHEYCLMAGADGRTMRHDEQCGDNHRGDEPYTICDAVEFCQEMNNDLLCDGCSNKEYLAQLRKDEHILDGLMERLARHSASVRAVC